MSLSLIAYRAGPVPACAIRSRAGASVDPQGGCLDKPALWVIQGRLLCLMLINHAWAVVVWGMYRYGAVLGIVLCF